MAGDSTATMSIGDRLKTERLLKGMSLTQLADKAGVSKAYLSQLEAGHQANPSLEVLKRIGEALHITVGRLVGGEGVRAAATLQKVDDPGLEAFVEERRRQGKPIPERDIQLLLNLQWRGGRRLRTKEDWATFYEVIVRMWDSAGVENG